MLICQARSGVIHHQGVFNPDLTGILPFAVHTLTRQRRLVKLSNVSKRYPDTCFACVLQVMRTCEQLDQHGFTDIQTFECLLRNYEVAEERLSTDFYPERVTSGRHHRLNQLQQAAAQQDQAHADEDADLAEARPSKKQCTTNNKAVDAAASHDAEPVLEADATEDANVAACADVSNTDAAAPDDTHVGGTSSAQGDNANKQPADAELGVVKSIVAKPVMAARGHTGYLTFARKFVVATQAEWKASYVRCYDG